MDHLSASSGLHQDMHEDGAALRSTDSFRELDSLTNGAPGFLGFPMEDFGASGVVAAASARQASGTSSGPSALGHDGLVREGATEEDASAMVMESGAVPAAQPAVQEQPRSYVAAAAPVSMQVVPSDDRRKRNPAFLNTRPRFWELKNDVLMADVFDALMRAQTEWLTARDIQSLLDFCRQMKLGARAPHRPPSGAIFYFDSRAGEYFRRDGYDYIKKKGSGISVREDHVKLRQGTVAVIYASYVHSAEWTDPVSGASLFHRRSYWHVDTDESERGIVVHYLGNQDANIEPMQRAHDPACECILCCLKRENSRPDRPGESLEQVLSRAQKLIATARTKKKRASSVSSQSSVAGLSGGLPLPPLAQSMASSAADAEQRKKKRRSKDDIESSSQEGSGRGRPSAMSNLTEDTSSDDGGGESKGGGGHFARPPSINTAINHHGQGWFMPQATAFDRNRMNDEDSALGSDVLSPGMEHIAADALDNAALESLQGLLTPVQSRRHSEFDSIAASLDGMFPPWSGASFGRQPAVVMPSATKPPQEAVPSARQPVLPSDESQQQHALQHQRRDDEEAQKMMMRSKKARDPVTQKPATRFDFNNLHVSEVSPARLRERERTLAVIGMARLPETLNHRTWTEKVFPRLSLWLGEYRVPALSNVALGVVGFECPPLFRSGAQHPKLVIRCEGMTGPIPFSQGAEPIWESSVGGGELKRPRPSFATPVRGESEFGERRKTLSPVGGDHKAMFGGGGATGEDEEEEIAEEEDLDRRATMMVERVVRLMTTSGASKEQVAEIINEVSPENGLNFLHTAVFCGATVEVIQMLLSHGADPAVRTRDSEENTSLHLACDQGNVPIARLLITAGADSNAQNARGQTPFEMIMSREENEADAELFALLGVQPPSMANSQQAQSQQQPFSPLRASVASPRPSTPLRSASALASVLGDKDHHITLLRDALTSLSLQEQCALTLATSMNSEERKTRRSASVASSGGDAMMASNTALGSSSGLAVVASGAATGDVNMDAAAVAGETIAAEDQHHDDVARVVSEAQPSLLEALNHMSAQERTQLDNEARRIQSNVRAWLLRRQFLQVREAAKKVQALAKGHLARRHFRELREKASATLVIQKSLRAHILAKKARQQQQQLLQQQQQEQQRRPQPQEQNANAASALMAHEFPGQVSATPSYADVPLSASGMIDERRLSLALQHPNPLGMSHRLDATGEHHHHPADSLIHSSEDLFMEGDDSIGPHLH